jgi:hypothetical protein
MPTIAKVKETGRYIVVFRYHTINGVKTSKTPPSNFRDAQEVFDSYHKRLNLCECSIHDLKTGNMVMRHPNPLAF